MLWARARAFLSQLTLTPEEEARIEEASHNLSSAGFDDWGLDPNTFKKTLGIAKWLYRDYFSAVTTGIEKVPAGRVLIVSNHGGQMPLDGVMIITALALEKSPARIGRGMVERWFTSLPFVSTFFTRCGLMVGDPRNCLELLKRDECVVVFPEGVRGSGKPYAKRYQLQRFGTGFVRLALETRTPIVPVSVVGSEETYPAFTDLEPLAKKIGVPYIPITPLFPWFGALGAIPLPAKFHIKFGEPLYFDTDPDASDAEVEVLVERVKTAIREGLDEGLKARGDQLFNKPVFPGFGDGGGTP